MQNDKIFANFSNFFLEIDNWLILAIYDHHLCQIFTDKSFCTHKRKKIIGNFKDKTFQFYGFVELIVHGASLLSLWNLMSSWVCGKSRKPKTRKTMCCEDSIFKDSFMEKEYLSFIRVNFDRCCRHFFATSLILPKIQKKK